MDLQRILDADLMTHLQFLGELVALISMVILGSKNQTRPPAYPELSGEMIGLYYRLESGVELYICHVSRDKARMIAKLIKILVKRSSEAKDVVDINAFRQVCGEAFNPAKLHTKLIPSTASIYPMYRNTGVIVRNPDAEI
jgi:hypothetical protein